MKDGGDVFGVLGWGLRKYSLLVVVCMVALGFLVPRVLDRVPDTYEAQAQVGPTEALNLPNLDPLPRLGETVFNNGVVADAVRQSVNPAIPRTQSVVPERVELIAAQDNIVFTIVGRGKTPDAAESVANTAAATFTQELNKYAQSVGSFAIQRLATPPTRPVPKIEGNMSLGIGVLSGLVAGVGAVALLLIWRRPVVDALGAQATAGAPVFGRVKLTPSSDGTRGMPQLSRRVVSGHTEVLLLAGPHSTRRERRILMAEMTNVLGWTRGVVAPKPMRGVNRSFTRPTEDAEGRRNFVIVNEPTQIEVATRPERSLTLLVVREGTPHSALRSQVEQYLDDGAAGLILVHGSRLHPRWWLQRLHRRERAPKSRRASTRSWSPDDRPEPSGEPA
jgi:hypothetical protein